MVENSLSSPVVPLFPDNGHDLAIAPIGAGCSKASSALLSRSAPRVCGVSRIDLEQDIPICLLGYRQLGHEVTPAFSAARLR